MEGKVVASCPGPSSDPGKDSDWEICASNVAYHLGGCPEATASCPLLPPLRREHGGDRLCSSLSTAQKCCSVGGLGYIHTCVLDTFPMRLRLCVQCAGTCGDEQAKRNRRRPQMSNSTHCCLSEYF